MKNIYLIAFLIVFSMSNKAFASTDAAKQFVEQTSQNVIDIVKSDKSASSKEALLDRLFVNVVDVNWMAKFSVANYWRQATPKQQEQYMSVYKTFLIQSYVPKFREYSNQKVQITKVASDGDDYTVDMQIVSKDSTVDISYKIHFINGKYSIYDIIAEGISLLTTERADFGAILGRDGLSGLISQLNSKIH